MKAKAKRSSLDIISNLPPNIIETILCLVPIKDAVRTSILSSKWRYNWVTIPKLVFNENDMFDDLFDQHPLNRLVLSPDDEEEPCTERKKLTRGCKLFYAIYQVMLMHEGPLLEFALIMKGDNTCVEIDQIITYLSRNQNTLKKFTLDLAYYQECHLPSSILLLQQLTDLYLCNCQFYPKPEFIRFRFGNLTSLYMNNVCTLIKTVARLLSNSPLLKNFTLIADLPNQLHYDNYSFYELFKYLLVIEQLTLSLSIIEESQEEVPQELPSALIHLKYICLLDDMSYFSDTYGLPFLVLMIRSSPNLEKLRVQMDTLGNKMDFVTLQDYSDIWLEHLNELEIEMKNCRSLKFELKFLKLILVKSPVLKKVSIMLSNEVANDEKFEFLTILLRSPRASPVVEIIVECAPRR